MDHSIVHRCSEVSELEVLIQHLDIQKYLLSICFMYGMGLGTVNVQRISAFA